MLKPTYQINFFLCLNSHNNGNNTPNIYKGNSGLRGKNVIFSKIRISQTPETRFYWYHFDWKILELTYEVGLKIYLYIFSIQEKFSFHRGSLTILNQFIRLIFVLREIHFCFTNYIFLLLIPFFFTNCIFFCWSHFFY